MAVLTNHYKTESVNNFISSIEDSKNSHYVFVGRAEPWLNANGDVDENAVIPANTSINQVELDVYQEMVYAKILTPADIIHMSKRYNWTNNTIYARYDNTDANLYSKAYYVITDTKEVYKCIHNGYGPETPNGVPSLFKPSVTQTSGNFETPDGYIWKYMFTVESKDYDKFQTNDYFPVTPNTQVQENSISGTIDHLVILNSGNNFQVFENGFIKNFVNNYVIELGSNSSSIDNYYTDSSIYLASGFGSGQLRRISSYEGSSKLLSVDPAFEYFENLKLADISGNFTVGSLVTQKVSSITYRDKKGFFNENDIVIQTETGAVGVLRNANSTNFKIEHTTDTNFTTIFPIYNTGYAPIQKSGKVFVNTSANSFQILSNTATTFNTEFTSGDFIRVGEIENSQIRRVTAVNTTTISVNVSLNTDYNSANIYIIPAAVSVDSLTRVDANGFIVFTNLDSAELTYSNVTPATQNFVVGETVTLVDEANTSQAANGTISFSNSSTLILSNVRGTFDSNLFVFGLTSKTRAYINFSESFPNITIETTEGGFESGSKISVKNLENVTIGNAFITSTYSSPNELTEYIISPKVSIEGDGNGALAYCTVDLSSNNPNRSISSVVLISGGNDYTRANVSISANTLYGNGAVVQALVSPVNGHGSDPYSELNSAYVGISKKFETAINESYKLPVYGSYRTVGIIKNPYLEEAVFELNNFDRTSLSIDNSTGLFDVGEIIVQNSSNSAGVVVSANTEAIEIKNTTGSFVFDSANTANVSTIIYGWSSNSEAHVTAANTKYFVLSSNLQSISEITPGGTADINQVISNTEIRVTNILGSFAENDAIYSPTTNTHANIVAIYSSNGTVNSTSNFGNVVNQTARLTLFSNTGPFSKYEYVTQDITFATGKIISTIDEIDLVYNASENFVVGDIILNTTTGANAIVTFANTSAKYLRLSGVSNEGFNETTNKPFNSGDTIENFGSTKISTINTVYSVLVLTDVHGITSANSTPFLGKFQIGDYSVRGEISGSEGSITLANSVKYPDLVRNSGKVLYLENLNKFDKTSTTTEQVKLIVKF
jgi:hypothetical protein